MTRVVVIGGGNAGLCAAISAREQGADVELVERAPKHLRGGNSAFTAGLMRTAYDGWDDLSELIDMLSDSEIAETDFGSYSREEFLDTIGRVTGYRCDPDLADTLTTLSRPTLRWMREHGVRFAASYGRQAFRHEGRFRFWGGAVLEVVGGGVGLVDALFEEAERMGIAIRYGTRAVELLTEDGSIRGVRCVSSRARVDLDADSVVLAAGGFQADAEWRAKYLGPGWDLAKVRGTRFNTGDGIRMALAAGGSPSGNWSGCHAVAWDQNAPEFGDLAVGDGFQKHSYPCGILVNSRGDRFVDEGADFRN
ncbi:MAG: FAD-dependent oxidoreductase, partial [Acidimicrobiales bacterium]|nr:FAD-dependent oxidoreductase [Acidimicrobiales bacterium]